ncbi:MAG: hypothetical protein ABI818_05785 [Acidobacteriota bacterium]
MTNPAIRALLLLRLLAAAARRLHLPRHAAVDRAAVHPERRFILQDVVVMRFKGDQLETVTFEAVSLEAYPTDLMTPIARDACVTMGCA